MVSLADNALTTLSAVLDELPLADDDAKSYLKRQINFASAAIEKFLGRKLGRVVGVVEDVAGFGGNRIIVERTPLEVLTDIEIVGDLIPTYPLDVADLTIENAEAGFIHRAGGFPWTAPRIRGLIASDPLAGHEDKTIRVTYTGGFVLPKDQPLTPAVSTALELPPDIERACILAVSEAFSKRGRRRDVRSERIMDYAATYGGTRGATATATRMFPSSPFSDEVTSLLLPYRVAV